MPRFFQTTVVLTLIVAMATGCGNAVSQSPIDDGSIESDAMADGDVDVDVATSQDGPSDAQQLDAPWIDGFLSVRIDRFPAVAQIDGGGTYVFVFDVESITNADGLYELHASARSVSDGSTWDAVIVSDETGTTQLPESPWPIRATPLNERSSHTTVYVRVHVPSSASGTAEVALRVASIGGSARLRAASGPVEFLIGELPPPSRPVSWTLSSIEGPDALLEADDTCRFAVPLTAENWAAIELNSSLIPTGHYAVALAWIRGGIGWTVSLRSPATAPYLLEQFSIETAASIPLTVWLSATESVEPSTFEVRITERDSGVLVALRLVTVAPR
jgi:hypothetical protein